MWLAHKGERVIHCIVDYPVVIVAVVAIIVVMDMAGVQVSPPLDYLVVAVTYVCYFCYSESKNGKTIGKRVTCTRVVRDTFSPEKGRIP